MNKQPDIYQTDVESSFDETKNAILEDVTTESIAKDPFEAVAKKRADKIIKKNKREIKRLTKHAENCLLSLNKEGYIYAIGKIRSIIRKPLDREIMEVMYNTSVERLIEIAKEATNQQK